MKEKPQSRDRKMSMYNLKGKVALVTGAAGKR